jgi:hypothetical protein
MTSDVVTVGETAGYKDIIAVMRAGLPQPEQVEMADHEGGADGHCPAGCIHRPDTQPSRVDSALGYRTLKLHRHDS